MTHKMARMLLFGVWSALVLGLSSAGQLAALSGTCSERTPERAVFLAGHMAPDRFVAFAAAASARADSILLVDSGRARNVNRKFLDAYGADKLIVGGSFTDGIAELESRLDRKTIAWSCRPTREEWLRLFPRANTVVVCPAEPRGMLLQAACLAGTLRAPLIVWEHDADQAEELAGLLKAWQTRQLYAVGDTAKRCGGLAKKLMITELTDEETVRIRHVKALACQSTVQTLVVANPNDLGEERGGMSALAPWIAVRHRAALLLTNTAGDNVETIVKSALKNEDLRCADALILVANLQAIPMVRRANPIPEDKDPFIEMEPMTPSGSEPFTFATGRLFHQDPAVVLLMLARQRLVAEAHGPRRALVASNAGSSMALLETFSRNTAKELRNAGYQTTMLVGKDVNRDELRQCLQNHDIFLWEGHHNTLIKDYAMPEWDDPLPPSLVFLQSCLALTEEKTHPLLEHGAIGVVGSSTRVYSASGGACSLAFFDALLYDDQSLGGSLRQAKNFLVAYARLKEKRLGANAKRSGANLRGAWAFTLWGDPTLRLPKPDMPQDALPAVQHEVRGNTIIIRPPEKSYDKVSTYKYQVQMPPNGRLAGLVHPDAYEDGKPLVPFLFAEVHLPQVSAGQTPRLQSRLPSSRFVFCWDARRSPGYLLIEPRVTDTQELHFHVHWGGDATGSDLETVQSMNGKQP